ncbi:YDG domain-containing protein [Herbaspirillum aquaticum]|uniref:Filamentous hemagglutinin n=1 Tax=Herbaspirillum aquaticum TaxID=568783 RepID=A0A225SUB4_9BURK|nr:YDG domain-containing protein [Herbaspirillum aquaticum]OWY34774.1 filamentous hemagglutinin [Herbaspirillum aquaticum]
MTGHASLNRIYRLVWSTVHQAWVAVSEVSRSQGKSRNRQRLAAALLMSPLLAQAGPVGGQVTAGSGSIAQSGTTTTVTQSSQSMSANWQSFNTARGETVNFVQPSASAVAVNRIHDTNPTQFFGQLNANGQVYLINPNGILFGAGAQVNVGGLVASTLDMSDASLASASRRFSGNGTGSIVNQGDINVASGGYVAFIGNTVSNQGNITAPSGAVMLGAGNDVTLTFADTSLVKLQVNQNTLDSLAENGGLIRVDGGSVVMSAGAKDAVLASVVNNTGIIEARSVQNVNGTIILDGGNRGSVSNSGRLDASGKNTGQTGGTVKVLGHDVTLAAGSSIDISGDTGGGTALVGGNFLGAGPEQNAQATTVAVGATINADAISNGNGGNVAIWSDGSTIFNGSITARGGKEGGNGGQVETSGEHLTVGKPAVVNTLAPKGKVGSWLLDPQDMSIYYDQDPNSFGDISGAQITAALQYSDVTIKTGPTVSCTNVSGCGAGISGNGDINLVDGVLIGGMNWTSGTTLTLSAYRNINLGYGTLIDASVGNGNIVLRADNTGTGTGSVKFDANALGVQGNNGYTKIYYNPDDYFHPTDFSLFVTMIGSGQFNAYMAINLTAGIVSKTYDGTTTATLSGAINPMVTPPWVTINTSGAIATFNDRFAGTNKAVTISGVTLSGPDSGKYFLNGLDGKTGTINKANLTVNGGLTANDKTYNGTTTATISGTASVAAFGSDSVSVSLSSANFSDKNAGTNKAVTATYVLTGSDSNNYNLIQPTGLTANINKANVTVTGATANSKTYDGTTTATVSGGTVTAFGSDAISLSLSSANFSDKNAGSNKGVGATYVLTGTDANNYNLIDPTGLTATINKANLTVGGISASDKTYDTTTSATLSGTASVTALGSDVVSVTGTGVGTFINKNAGSNKAVTVSGYSLTGSDAGNYNIVQPTGLTATINKASLNVSGVTANNKTYDATTAATLAGTASVTALGSDVVSVTGSGVGTFANKNAGSGKAVAVSGYSLTGADASNYNIVQPTGLVATISKADLVVGGVSASNKTYDATTTATLAGTASVAALGSDVVSVTGGVGAFGDKNAGSNKAVTVTGYTLGGADAGNYNLIQPTGLTATISKADLNVNGISANSKTYDASTNASLSGTASVAALGSDVVSVSGTGAGSFADKNAGINKAVIVSGYTLTGSDAGNYNLIQPTGLTATINKANLGVSGVGASDKTYDATTTATLTGTASVAALGSDVVSLAGTGVGTFADKNAGTGKTVNVTGFTLTGSDAGNYNIVQPTGLTATINKASLTPTGGVTVNSKVYDGTTVATVSGAASVTALGADAVTLVASGRFNDKNVGSNKAVTVTYALAGADSGNYDVVQPASQTANITPAPLVVSGITAGNKTFDGTTSASINAANALLGGKVSGDDVTVTASGAFTDPAVGNGKLVNLFSRYGGADAGNYMITDQTSTLANILAVAAASPVASSSSANLPPQVRDTVTQVQSSVLSPQSASRPQSLTLSPTLTVRSEARDDARNDEVSRAANIDLGRTNLGAIGPLLQIRNGGTQLPDDISRTAE